jgi:hypothetical protein
MVLPTHWRSCLLRWKLYGITVVLAVWDSTRWQINCGITHTVTVLVLINVVTWLLWVATVHYHINVLRTLLQFGVMHSHWPCQSQGYKMFRAFSQVVGILECELYCRIGNTYWNGMVIPFRIPWLTWVIWCSEMPFSYDGLDVEIKFFIRITVIHKLLLFSLYIVRSVFWRSPQT